MFKKIVTAAAVGFLITACGGGDAEPDLAASPLDAGLPSRSTAAAVAPQSTPADGSLPGEVLVKLLLGHFFD